MKVSHNAKTEDIVLTFSLRHRKMALMVIADAIKRYQEAGADTTEIEEVLWFFEITTPSIQ